MTFNVIQELRKVGHALPARIEPIPLSFSGVGLVGHLEHRRGIYVNSGIKSHVQALVRDHYRAERVARDISNGLAGADDLLPIAQRMTDSRDAIRVIKSMQSAITSWDAVVNARSGATAKYWDFVGTKASQTTVAANWSSFLRTAGVPAAMANVAIPGAAPPDNTTVGAWPIPITLSAGEDLYLTNFGQNHLTGTNITFLVDVLTANGSISTTIVTSQNVNSTALTRWTGGAGVLMTLEVTNAPGASTGVPNITVNYTDQSGNTLSTTGLVAQGTTSPIVGRLVPLQDGPMIRLASGDWGVRSIEQVTISLSSATAGGALAAIQYKPVLMIPTLATTSFVERSTPAQVGGIRRLTSVSAGSMPCLGFFVNTSTTSTGVQTYLLELVYG